VKKILKDKLKYKISVYFLLFTVSCLLAACATTQDVDLVSHDVNRLHRDYLTVKTDIEKLRENTAGFVREDSFNALRQSQAEIQSSLSILARDIQNLSGRFEENKYFIEKTLKNSVQETDLVKLQITTLEGQIKEIKDKLNGLEAQMQQKESLKAQLKENEKRLTSDKDMSQPEEQPVKAATADEKKTKYDEAYNTFQNKKYKEARDKFEAFIKEYPEDRLTDNAYFWIAETYYGEKDFEGSIISYETFLKKFPKSEKGPAALLKQGLAFIEIGDKKTGEIILKQVTERYPNSKESDLAKKNIENLKKDTGKRKR
jgi:tol-pal system protein YbgF